MMHAPRFARPSHAAFWFGVSVSAFSIHARAQTTTDETSSAQTTTDETSSARTTTDGDSPAPAAPAAPEVEVEVEASAGPETAPMDEGDSAREVEVVVSGPRNEAQRLQESAEAVTVVDTRKAQRQTADLGEVLARTQGVGVRREGGLGSNSTISLNGLQGDQVRLFFDGVPLHVAGYPFGLANIAVNLVERVEIYRGVVPIRFGADALGGAINVVGNQRYDTYAAASHQVGSFGTVRSTANGLYEHEPSGIVIGAVAYLDSARNDFMMDDRPLPLPDGSTVYKTVRRFHDDYRAYGGHVEAGVVDQRWAKRLLVQGFASTFDKALQHNSLMTVPYGEVRYGETITGATLRYEVAVTPNVELETIVNYAYRVVDFQDLSPTIYTWEGQRGRPVGREGARGEIRGVAIDRSLYQHGVYVRAGASWTFLPGHVARLYVTPEITDRIGDDHVPDRPDLLELRSGITQVVSGVEYEGNWLEDRLQNVFFVKDYYFEAFAEDHALITGNLISRSQSIHRLGVGDGLRFRFTPWLLGKLSYEHATRLPRPDELFGDGALIEPSANSYNETLLKPEVSDNFNLGPRLDLRHEEYGNLIVDVNGFVRETKDMIMLLAGQQFIPYSNLADARTIGIENAASWSSPGRLFGLDGTFTYQDVRNTSTEGPFEPQQGMRIPSRPYLFANWGARVRVSDLPDPDEAVELFYNGRYVHGFERGWQIGNPTFKLAIPAQVSHSLGVTWLLNHEYGSLASTLEISNLTDAELFDVFGVQRAGRAVYLKLSGQI